MNIFSLIGKYFLFIKKVFSRPTSFSVFYKSFLNEVFVLGVSWGKLEFLSSIGVSDGRYFADDNINIINIGPGSGSEGHKSNEKIINKDLIDYFYLLENFLLKF